MVRTPRQRELHEVLSPVAQLLGALGADAQPTLTLMEGDRIERVADHLVDGVQEWVRHTDDDEIRGVGALQREVDGRWNWHVEIWVAEFLREEPLEGEMRSAVANAIRSIPGVTEVAQEDREVRILSGDVDGRLLVHTVGDAIDQIAPRARAYLDALAAEGGS